MTLKRSVLFFAILLIFVSVCFAEITIYFKDGKDVKVSKIVFKGTQADLYLVTGTIMSVSVDSIDLDLSGIGKPVGTYGETRVTGNSPVVPRGIPMIDSSARQAELKEEWENATVTAVAKKDVGSIHKGDTVHAYSPDSQASSKPGRATKYYWYDDDRGIYYYDQRYSAPITPDQAYMIIFKKADGTLGKKILDAATFAATFDIQKTPAVTHPVPVMPVEPQPQQQPPTETTAPPAETERPSNPAAQEDTSVKPKEEPATTSVQELQPKTTNPVQKNRPRLWILPLLGIAIVLGIGLLLFLRGRTRPFVDTSKFAQYERDLREFEVEIWLRHGKTMDQLMEIGLKKLYQDQPAALNIAMKIAKGNAKSWVLPFLIKEAGVSGGQAELLYTDFDKRVASVRKVIEEVSAQKGIPLKPDVAKAQIPQQRTTQSSTPPTMKMATVSEPAPAKAAAPAAQPANVSSPVAALAAQPAPRQNSFTSSAVEISLPVGSRAGEDSAVEAVRSGELPSYVTNLLEQLSFLSSERK